MWIWEKIKMKVKCGWCSEEFETNIVKEDYGRNQLICSNCCRILPSSKITRENGKHFHSDWKDGDVVV
jgi:hypothetical protein